MESSNAGNFNFSKQHSLKAYKQTVHFDSIIVTIIKFAFKKKFYKLRIISNFEFFIRILFNFR